MNYVVDKAMDNINASDKSVMLYRYVDDMFALFNELRSVKGI